MPNWATTTLRIANTHNHTTSPAAAERAQGMLQALVSGLSTETHQYGEHTFTSTTLDFNAVLPMPEELRETTSPMAVVDTPEEAQRRNEKYSDTVSHSLDGKVRAIDTETADRWRRDYGAIDWYGWANTHWGTKWPASDVTVHSNTVESTDPTVAPTLVLTMDTAWVEPSGVIAHLIDAGLSVTAGVIYEDGCEFEHISSPGDFGEYFTIRESTELIDEDNPDEGSWTRRWIEVRDCACDSCGDYGDA